MSEELDGPAPPSPDMFDSADAAQEQAHLSALRADFQRNVERLDGLADTQDRVSRASGDLLLIARGHESASPDSVDRLLGEVFSSDRFDPVMGVYENLINSGGLDFNREFMGRLGWADAVARHLRGHEDGDPEETGGTFNQALLDDAAFQDHLALRSAAQRQVADMYRELAGQARLVLEGAETLIR